MTRYFIEVTYRGTNYAGFQRQANAHTVQAEVEQALKVLFRQAFELTGSSRTDAGVHAMQNYFHFDSAIDLNEKIIYNLNALLPDDLAVNHLIAMPSESHSRYDAISREYRYNIYRQKQPFLVDRAYYFPYKIDFKQMQEVAGLLKEFRDFTSFSKRNTQVKTFICQLHDSEWQETNYGYCYYVKGNRFLRGMVRALTATMLRVGRGKISREDFIKIIEARDCTLADFAVPAHGLTLERVNFPPGYFEQG